MVNTSHLLIPLLMPNQVQKEIIINEVLIRIDTILNQGIKSIHVNIPLTRPKNGDTYIIDTKSMKEWETKNQYIAYYRDEFIKSNESMQFG
ncbi:MAG: DUF2793 domain-containing protein [Rickettsiales endosymbiont of Dermacentor nuttalli]